MSSNLKVDTTNRPTPAGLLSLPLELHEKIFRCVCEPKTTVLDDPAAAEVPDEDTNVLLHPLMLVCKLLNERTVGFLCESIDITTSRRTRLLRRTVTLDPSLGKLVKRLGLSLSTVPDPNHDAFSGSTMDRFLKHLVNVTSLSTEDFRDHRSIVFSRLIGEAKFFGLQLSELSIKPSSRRLPGSNYPILFTSSYFENPLKHLSIDRCIMPQPRHCDITLWNNAPPVLQSIVLTRSFVEPYGLKYLLQNSGVSLKTLVFDMHSGPLSGNFDDPHFAHFLYFDTFHRCKHPELVTVMESISPALERLELYWNESFDYPMSSIVSRFPKLGRLGWGGSLSDSVSAVLSYLPLKLEELVIERCPAVTSEHILALVNGGTSSLYPQGIEKPRSLKKIEIGPGMGWTGAGWEDVRAACRREGVLVGFARTHAGLKPDPKVVNTPVCEVLGGLK